MFHKRFYFFSFLIIFLLLIQGCAGTSTLYSNTFIKPTNHITKLNVIYIQSNLVSTMDHDDVQFYDIGYTDLPELLRERVALVFPLNNISSEYATFKSQNFGQKEAMESLKWTISNTDAMLLTLQVLNGRVVTGPRTPETTTINIQANLIDPKTKLRHWTGQFRNIFIAPPIGKNGFDNEFVDKMLKSILEQMSQDGVIALTEHNVIIPSAKPPAVAK